MSPAELRYRQRERRHTLASIAMVLGAVALIVGWRWYLNIPAEPPRLGLYYVSAVDPRSGRAASAVVRAFGERHARQIMADRWRAGVWLDAEATACFPIDELAGPSAQVLLERVTP